MGTDVSGIAKVMLQARANGSIKAVKEEPEQNMTVNFMELLNQSSLSSGASVSADAGKMDVAVDTENSTKTAYDTCSKPMKSVSVKEQVTPEEMCSEMETSIEAYEEEIRSVLKEELGVTDEEISAAMESLGMGFLDLHNLQNLATLMQTLTGEDVGTLFLSDSFQTIMEQVTVLTDELCTELGITKEELSVLSETWKQMEANVPVNDEVVESSMVESNPEKTEVMSDIAVTDVKENDMEENHTIKADITVDELEEKNSMEENSKEVNPEKMNPKEVDSVETSKTGEVSVEVSDKVQDATIARGEDVSNVEIVEDKVEPEEIEAVVAQTEEQQPEENLDDVDAEDTEKQSLEMNTVEEMVTEDNTEESGESSDGQLFSKQSQDTKTDTSNAGISIAGQQQSIKAEEFVIPQEHIQPYTSQVDAADLIQQIARNVRVTISATTTSMEMQLNPANLGKIYLNITERDGVIRAQIATQTETVRDALETQLVELRQTLSQQGIKVDAIEVTVATHEFEQNLEGNARQEEQMHQQMEESGKQTRKNLNLNDLDGLSGLMTEEEQLAAQIMRDNGNQVDLTA